MNRRSNHEPDPAAAAQTLRLELARCKSELLDCRKRLSEIVRAEKLKTGQKRLLEMIANGEALGPILETLCRLSEELSEGVLVSILLLSPDGKTLRQGAAPSLPPAYSRAIDGGLIGPEVASCGTAAHRGQTVVVSDIATDPLWANYRDLALEHGLRACWSTPIFSTTRQVLGTFAFYTLLPGPPTPEQRNAVEQFAHLASIVIERARAQEALLRSEAYLGEAQRLSRTGSFGWNITTGEHIWSHETLCILGYDRAVKPSLELALKRVHPDDLVFVENTLRQATTAESDMDFEHRLLLPDGTLKHVHVRARAHRAREGEVEFVGAVMDITDRKNAQESLRAAKARFEGILEIADDAIISVNASQHVTLFNQGAERVFGYEAQEVIGQSLDVLLPAGFLEAHQRHLESSAAAPEAARPIGARRTLFGRRKDGVEFPAEASVSKLVLGDEVVFTVILRDITERNRLETQLRESEKNLAEGQRLTKTGSWILDYGTGLTNWSTETCRIFGFPDPPPSPHYSEFLARVRAEDREAVDRSLRESFERGEPRPLKYVFNLPDGVRKHIETLSMPVKDETGRIVQLMGTVMDVTERTQAEDAIRASEKWARGQAEALTRILDALARESSSDCIVEHVVRTIAAQLDALDCSVWLRDIASDRMSFQFALENQLFKSKTDAKPGAGIPSVGVEAVWPVPELILNGRPHLLEDIRAERDFPLRAHIIAQGVVSILRVPMMISGKVEGMIVIRFSQRRTFRPEEMELAQSLAHQAMLALQLRRLSLQSREAAVLAERNRLARDIHDTLAQGFTGVIVQLEAAEDAMTKHLPAEALAHGRRAADLARESLREARRSVYALRPVALGSKNLCSALAEWMEKMTAGTGLSARVISSGVPGYLSQDHEYNLLRVCQEALTNVLRHAAATHFEARVFFELDRLRLELSDDGAGFDVAAVHEGFGLNGMRERIESLGGNLTIHSAAGQGTVITVVLPLAESPPPLSA